MSFTLIALILLLLFVSWLLRIYWSVLTTRGLPPGPFPFPIIGNMHLLFFPMHVSLEKLAKKYGDLMTIYLGTERAVIATSPEFAHEVLVRQSRVFGGRPTSLSFGADLMSNNGKMIVTRHDMSAKWKKQRTLFHRALKSFGNGLLVIQEQVCDVVKDLIGEIGKHQGTVRDIGQDVRLCIANTVCSMTLGSKYKKGDKEFKMIVEACDLIQGSVAPGHLVDVFPFLQKLPIKYVVDLKKANKFKEDILMREFRAHESRLENGDSRDLTGALLKQRRSEIDEDVKLTDEEIQMTMFDILIAGLETSSATILWGINFLARHLEVQDTIQEEMRRCLGPDSPPTYNDRRRLPFLQATVTEIYRYSFVVPVPIPHRAVQDAYIRDYFIPAGTTVMVNSWAIHRSPRIWNDPDVFRPSRFLDENGNYSAPSPLNFLPFGAGKRGCPVEVLGKMMVFVTFAQMLYHYRFTLVSDQNVGLDTKRQVIVNPRGFEVLIEKTVWN